MQDFGGGTIPSAEVMKSLSINTQGSLFGVGIEQSISTHLSAKLEYDYVNYGSILSTQSISVPFTNSPVADSFLTLSNHFVKVEMNKIMLGLSYHFM